MAVCLDQSPLPSSVYNALPHINTCKTSGKQNIPALNALLSIIHRHGLDQCASVHLIHKHFDLKENKIMVYETVSGPNHPDFLLSSPRDPTKCVGLRGLYFKAAGGNLVAYEFTTDTGADVSDKNEFLAEFHATIVHFGVEDVFALTLKAPEVTNLTELELPDYCSTILVNDAPWLNPSEDATVTFTDWVASQTDLLGVQKGVWDIEDKHSKVNGKLDGISAPSAQVQQLCLLERDGKHTKIDAAQLQCINDHPGRVQQLCLLNKEGKHEKLDIKQFQGAKVPTNSCVLEVREANQSYSSHDIDIAQGGNGESNTIIDGHQVQQPESLKERANTSAIRCVIDKSVRHWEWEDKLWEEIGTPDTSQQACWKDNFGRHVRSDTESIYHDDGETLRAQAEQSAILSHALSLINAAR